MKKKLIIYMIIVLFFSLIVASSLFIIIGNYQYIRNIEEELILNNKININLIKSNNLVDIKPLFISTHSDLPLRLTYIDKNGNIIEDSEASTLSMENHNNREEIIAARKEGNGRSIRYSETLNKNMLYVATLFEDGQIMRSAMPIEFMSIFYGRYLRYYIISMIAVAIMTFILSTKLFHVIVNPIRELESITSKFAKGELDRRYTYKSNDEIGELGKSFNDMADKLENTIKDSLEKNNRLQAILKSMDSGVIAVDRANNIIMINPYAKKIFGIKEDIIGKKLVDYIRDFDFEDIFKDSNSNYKEIKIFYPEERVLRIKTADIINESEHIGTVAVVQDITDIKKLENMRSEFVANVSHELKTPLTSIKGFAETLRYVKDEQIKDKFLNIIDDEVERLTRLINDILALSHIELHKEEKKELIDVNESAKAIFNLMKNTADNKDISLDIEGSIKRKIYGDSDGFAQMLINLVDNAIKYSEAKDKVIIRLEETKEFCTIIVEDTGVGIPKDHIPRLFERFYRVDKARSRARGGTGLGLAIVKHIVISFNGTIEVESELGKGSKFIVRIPFREEIV